MYNSRVSRSNIIDDLIIPNAVTEIKRAPNRKYRIYSSRIRPTSEKQICQNKKVFRSEMTSKKLIPITNIVLQKDQIDFNSNLIIPLKSPINLHTDYSKTNKNKDRLQMYKKMLQPKIIRTRMFSAGSKRQRAVSAQQRQRLPLLFTFGKQQ